MGKLNYEEELQTIKKLEEFMVAHNIGDSALIPKQMNIDSSLRIWFTARRHSLQIGSLEDEDILFFRNQSFDFGVQPLLWNEWVALLKSTIKTENRNSIKENFCIDNTFQLGKWTKRQIKLFKYLSPERKAMLAESGLHLDYLYGSRSPFCMVIYHEQTKYTNVIEFLRAVNAPLLPFFHDLENDTNSEEIIYRYIQDNNGRCDTKLARDNNSAKTSSSPNKKHYTSDVSDKPAIAHDTTEIEEPEEAKEATSNLEDHADEETNSPVVESVSHSPRKRHAASSFSPIGALMDSVDWEKTRSILQEQLRLEEESEMEAELASLRMHREAAREKLLAVSSGEYLDEFLKSISDEYLTTIATKNVYSTISSFEKAKIKKYIGLGKHTNWQLESPVSILPNGHIRGEFFAYVLCHFKWEPIQIKKILLQLNIGKRNDSSGGLYCEGESYIPLGSIEAFNIVDDLPKDIGKLFQEHKKNLHRIYIYQKVMEILDEIDYHWEIRSSKKPQELMDLLRSDTLTWENIGFLDAAELHKYLEPSFVNIKRVASESPELPNIYLISVMDNKPFIPEFRTRLIFTYKKRAYMFYVDRWETPHFAIRCRLDEID